MRSDRITALQMALPGTEQKPALSRFAEPYTVVDLFCGAGGLSYGLELSGRFRTLLGIDIRPEAVETFEQNHTGMPGMPSAIRADIKDVKPKDLVKELRRRGISEPGELDCLIGGPPCEGFSQNRTDRQTGERVHKFIDDPRNQLFRWFVECARALQPKIILIENVPDLLRHRDGHTRDEILAALNEIGYEASATVLNAADFGVPQIRRRAFFLGYRRDLGTSRLLEFPRPTHAAFPERDPFLRDATDWLPGDSGYWVSVREAIADLPPAADTGLVSVNDYPSVRLSTFRRLMRVQDGVITNHQARKLGKAGLSKLVASKLGGVAADLPDSIRPRSHYHYSYTRMLWSEPAKTITKFVYHVGSGQFGHPVDNRAITMREAARLQSFPDAFRFVGTSEIRKLSALIGGAVPPLLARSIAQSIAHYLDSAGFISSKRDSSRGDAVLRRLDYKVWRHHPTPTNLLSES